MALSAPIKSLLLNGLKGLGFVAVAFLVTWLASPAVANIVGTGNEWIITGVVIPLLIGAEHYLKTTSALKKQKPAS